jgi:uncharacterized protein (TIGR03663 family)
MNRALATWLVVALASGIGLSLRVPQLDVRPMHNDEAVNAIKFGQLWQSGAYKYDPEEHHGPSLAYFTFAVARLTGAPTLDHISEDKLRAVPVAFGIGLILLLPLVAGGLGNKGFFWAAIFTAVSPAMVFYSRYYIHETLLVFFTFLAMAAGWRYWRSRRIGWAMLAGAAAGLMQATKETFVLPVAAAALALGLSLAWDRWLDASAPPARVRRFKPGHAVAAVAVWFAVAVLLFSSFFSNLQGIPDSLKTYLPWLARAGGESPHIHPWTFYFERLLFFHPAKGFIWSEALIALLAVIGAYAGFARRGLGDAHAGLVRCLAFYTVGLAAAYSLIPYKTPWCLLGFLHGMILLAGVGAGTLIQLAGRLWPAREPVDAGDMVESWRWPGAAWGSRAVMFLLLMAGAVQLGAQAWQAGVTYAADPRNPYVYAQTSPDHPRLVDLIGAIARAAPNPQELVIKVMAPDSDYWPLPWYLRRFEHTGWWDQIPPDPWAPIMVVSSKLDARLDENRTHLMVGYFELRPHVFLEVYVEVGLWKAYLSTRPKPPPDSETSP